MQTLSLPHLTATMCFATASGPSRSVSHARTVRAFSIVSAVVNVLLRGGDGWEGGQGAGCLGAQLLHGQPTHARLTSLPPGRAAAAAQARRSTTANTQHHRRQPPDNDHQRALRVQAVQSAHSVYWVNVGQEHQLAARGLRRSGGGRRGGTVGRRAQAALQVRPFAESNSCGAEASSSHGMAHVPLRAAAGAQASHAAAQLLPSLRLGLPAAQPPAPQW